MKHYKQNSKKSLLVLLFVLVVSGISLAQTSTNHSFTLESNGDARIGNYATCTYVASNTAAKNVNSRFQFTYSFTATSLPPRPSQLPSRRHHGGHIYLSSNSSWEPFDVRISSYGSDASYQHGPSYPYQITRSSWINLSSNYLSNGTFGNKLYLIFTREDCSQDLGRNNLVCTSEQVVQIKEINLISTAYLRTRLSVQTFPNSPGIRPYQYTVHQTGNMRTNLAFNFEITVSNSTGYAQRYLFTSGTVPISASSKSFSGNVNMPFSFPGYNPRFLNMRLLGQPSVIDGGNLQKTLFFIP